MNKSIFLRRHKLNSQDKGIALIQILIITAILSVISIYITKSAQQQVKIAQWSMDKSQALVNLHGARNTVIFSLLTSTWQNNTVNISDAEQWNLYNAPVQLANGVTLYLQDQAGLVNLHYPQGGGIVEQVMLAHGLSESAALKTQGVLFDWQDADHIQSNYGDESSANKRDGAMPDIREWLLHNTINQATLLDVQTNFTLYGSSHLNLMTSPESLLAALTNSTVARQLITLRSQNQLTVDDIRQAVDLSSDMNIFLSPGNNVGLTLDAEYGEARVRQKSVINISPYVVGNQPPYNILQTSGG